jgi:uncharacterized protein YggU (UPF0235/DUF167 family)
VSLAAFNAMHIKVKVTAGSRTEQITRKSADSYKMSVKEKAERNLANKRVLEILRSLHPGKSIRIVKGHHSPSKIFEVGDDVRSL